MRTADEVARRAIVMGAMAMRASLEVTQRPRAAEISRQLLPWLETLGGAAAADPIEVQVLATPHGELRPEQSTDANWSGEGAAVFCWAIGIAAKPPACELADHLAMVETLKILHPEARILLNDAHLRPLDELKEFVVEAVCIRSKLQQLRVEPAGRAILENIARTRLLELGLSPCPGDSAHVARVVAEMSLPGRGNHLAGLYFVREHAATWLFDGRPTYFGE